MEYYILNKPYGYLSQFKDEGRWKGLKHLLNLKSDVYPIGRLDADSEGLLLLTDDKRINHELLNPEKAHWREYWVQVEGSVTEEQLGMLMNGVKIGEGKEVYTTMACRASVFETEPQVEQRYPPIRERKYIPTTWLKLELREGKNRQVRRMTAAVGCPTLRLIRHRIEHLTLEGIASGECIQIDKTDFLNKLALAHLI